MLNAIITWRRVVVSILILVLIACGLVFYAYYRTWNKTDIQFNLKIDEQIVYRSTYGESPTFAIWIEDPETGSTQTVYVTRRAAEGDWEGKADVPVAVPRWFEIRETKMQSGSDQDIQESEWQPVTSPTPTPGYFSARISVPPGSTWIGWVEVNLAGDYNETYQEYDPVAQTYDEFKTGQPPLLYRAEITAVEGVRLEPEIIGMSIIDPDEGVTIQPVYGITTAKDIFEEIYIEVVRPQPRIID